MGWSIGFDSNWNRDIGYGVPATCDHPECNAKIDRGLAYVCAHQEPYGGEDGCGLYFCHEHLIGGKCERCAQITEDGPYVEPFVAKPDHPEWINWKLTDPSWQKWRDDNPVAVALLRVASAGARHVAMSTSTSTVTKTASEILADIKRACADIERFAARGDRPVAGRRPMDILDGLGGDPLGGMRLQVSPLCDDQPRMTVTQKFADNMPPEFVADLNAWMLHFFGRENRVYCLHGHTLIVGQKTLAAMERSLGGQPV